MEMERRGEREQGEEEKERIHFKPLNNVAHTHTNICQS